MDGVLTPGPGHVVHYLQDVLRPSKGQTAGARELRKSTRQLHGNTVNNVGCPGDQQFRSTQSSRANNSIVEVEPAEANLGIAEKGRPEGMTEREQAAVVI